jgi:acetolactate synthase-1/2/3 large subunit
LARGCLPPDDPRFFSGARRHALENCDVLLGLGVDWDFRLGFGRKNISEDVLVVQVDVDGTHIGRNRPVDVGIVGDPGQVIEQLLAEGIGRAEEPAWTAEVREKENERRAKMSEGMESDAVPIHPYRFAREIRDFLDPDAVVVGDGGDIVGHTAAIVHARRPGHWLDPGPLGTLGVGPGFAIAAKLARADEQVLIVYGDGAFGLNAMEYDTAIRRKLPFVGIVGNDQAWGQTRVVQQAMYGHTAAADLADTPYERMVEALGGYGERVEKPTEIRPSLERAFDAGVPACINVMIDSSLVQRAPYL